jgi:hypothetical protein
VALFKELLLVHPFLNIYLATQPKSRHPNVLKIVGVSDESSKSHFVLSRGSKNLTTFVKSASMRLNKLVTSEQKMKSQIAKALGTDLNTSVQLSMKAVSSLVNLNTGIYLLYELQRQVKGIAV